MTSKDGMHHRLMTPYLEQALNRMIQEAEKNKHECLTAEHLLKALLTEAETRTFLEQSCQVNIARLSRQINRFLDDYVPNHGEAEVQPGSVFLRLLNRSSVSADVQPRKKITGLDLLALIAAERDTHAAYFLLQHGVDEQKVLRYCSSLEPQQDSDASEDEDIDLFLLNELEEAMEGEGVDDGHDEDHDEDEHGAEDAYFDPEHTPNEEPLKFLRNLNADAANGCFDPLIGRESELERIIQILCRRGKNHPLLTGDAGVGKTAIVRALAQKLNEGRVPQQLKDSVLYELDTTSLIAGTRYRGDFEERFKRMVHALDERAIVFIDEIHTISSATESRENAGDVANLLKPVLSASSLRCIGATTHKEYRNMTERDPAVTRRFQNVRIDTLSHKQSFEVLKQLRDCYEKFHEVRYTDNALARVVDLAGRYLSDTKLPDSAIDIMDEAGAYCNSHLGDKLAGKRVIDIKIVDKVVAKMAHVESLAAGKSHRYRLKHLKETLSGIIFGQEEALERITTSTLIAETGLGHQEKPKLSMLLSGGSGVGKTEFCRQFARALDMRLLRLDMSEYRERHTVSRLIGAPPGYVGYSRGGLLTEQVSRWPHSVILLDEIEKAHEAVYNLLLQVMDYGRLTDSNGRECDFSQSYVFMTTNAGVKNTTHGAMGFVAPQDDHFSVQGLKRTFSAEFRNRLDGVIRFNPLGEQAMLKIVDKRLAELKRVLSVKKIHISIDHSVRSWLAQHGYDPQMGARPLQRLIDQHIKAPLSWMFVEKSHSAHRKVRVVCDRSTQSISVRWNSET